MAFWFPLFALSGRFHLQKNFPKWLFLVLWLDVCILGIPLLLGQWLIGLMLSLKYFFLVMNCYPQWVPLSFPAVPTLWYCNGVPLAIGNIYFLCSGHRSVVALVLLVFGVFPSCFHAPLVKKNDSSALGRDLPMNKTPKRIIRQLSKVVAVQKTIRSALLICCNY